MKQMIVMLAMVALGVFLHQLIAGEDGGSVAGTLSHLWRWEIEARTHTP